MKFLMSNIGETTLAGALTEGATTVLLAPGTGVKFPQPGDNEFFPLTLIKTVTGVATREIVYVTARDVDSCTVMRAREGTLASTFSAGDYAGNHLTAGCLGQVVQQDGGVFTGTVDFSSQVVSKAVFKECAPAFKGDATNIIDIRNGEVQQWAPGTGAQSLTITGWPPAGSHGSLLLYLKDGGGANISITGASVNFMLDTGKFAVSNSLTTNHGVALQASGIDFILFWSPDGGATRYCKVGR